MSENNKSLEALSKLNHVDGFDPYDFLIDLPDTPENGEQNSDSNNPAEKKSSKYLPVNARILWFRLCHPEGRIIPSYTIQNDTVIVKTEVYLKGNSEPIAVGHAMKAVNIASKYRGLESTETASIGRALSLAGFGTQFCGHDFDEDPHEPADAPIPGNNNQNQQKPDKETSAAGAADAADKNKPESDSTKPATASTSKNRKTKTDKEAAPDGLSPETAEQLKHSEETMNVQIAMGTMVPTGMYKDISFKELLVDANKGDTKKYDVVWSFADPKNYVPKTPHDCDIIAAARLLKKRHDDNAAKQKAEAAGNTPASNTPSTPNSAEKQPA